MYCSCWLVWLRGSSLVFWTKRTIHEVTLTKHETRYHRNRLLRQRPVGPWCLFCVPCVRTWANKLSRYVNEGSLWSFWRSYEFEFCCGVQTACGAFMNSYARYDFTNTECGLFCDNSENSTWHQFGFLEIPNFLDLGWETCINSCGQQRQNILEKQSIFRGGIPFAKNAAADGDLYLSQPVRNSLLVLQNSEKRRRSSTCLVG